MLQARGCGLRKHASDHDHPELPRSLARPLPRLLPRRILFHGGTTGGDGERLADVFALKVGAPASDKDVQRRLQSTSARAKASKAAGTVRVCARDDVQCIG